MVKFKAEIHLLSLCIHYFAIICQNKCTSERGECLIHKASCKKAIVAKTRELASPSSPQPLKKLLLHRLKRQSPKSPRKWNLFQRQGNIAKILGSKNPYSSPLKFIFQLPLPWNSMLRYLLATRLRAASISYWPLSKLFPLSFFKEVHLQNSDTQALIKKGSDFFFLCTL